MGLVEGLFIFWNGIALLSEFLDQKAESLFVIW